MGNEVKVSERTGGKYTQDVIARGHKFYADEPESYGSADLGPTPYELVMGGLGACTTITLRMYAERKDWPVGKLSVDVTHKVLASTDGKKTNVFTRKISIEGDLDDAQRQRMLEIANKCPIHKVLESANTIETELT